MQVQIRTSTGTTLVSVSVSYPNPPTDFAEVGFAEAARKDTKDRLAEDDRDDDDDGNNSEGESYRERL